MLLNKLSRKVRNQVVQANIETVSREADAADVQRQPSPEEIASEEVSLVNVVSSVVSSQDRKPLEYRGAKDEYIHLSALIRNFCPRQLVLEYKQEQVAYKDYTNSNDYVVWAMGRAAEKHVRDQYIQAMDYKGVVGDWGCKCGKTRHIGLADKSLTCPTCSGGVLNYGEIRLIDQEYGISGAVDLILVINNKLYIVEIKSMNADDFNALKNPIGDHFTQAAGYHKLLEKNSTQIPRLGLEVAGQVIVLYVRKDYKMRETPYKEFLVDITDASKRLMDTLWDKARDLRIAKFGEGEPLPPKVCTEIGCTRAKNCPVVVDCFSRR